MAKNVLIINGHQRHEGIAEGNLNHSYITRAKEFFIKNGFNTKQTIVEDGYIPTYEHEKFVWADYILFQYPTYWMGLPWLAKKYFDDVFTHGTLYANDGRSRHDSSKRYGSGGLIKDTKYMLSITYNCPASEFGNKDGFFDGLSLDEANVAVHKTFQFCGMTPLKTYSIHDVYKDSVDFDAELDKFESMLKENFID